MKKIGLDVGDVRIGIAVSDMLGICANGRESYRRVNDDIDIKYFTDLAVSENADAFVVGLPVNMDGTHGVRAQRCEDFAAALTEFSGIETVMRDERLTTVSAHNALNITNTRGKKRKAVVDAVSAVMILQDYLDYRRINHLS